MTARWAAARVLLMLGAGFFAVAGSAAGQRGKEVASNSAGASGVTTSSTPNSATNSSSKSKPAAAPSVLDNEALRIEGEKRFATNCGRCHQSPHKFPPRMVMTIERHMRVRATLTAEDMRLIVGLLTQ